MKHSMTLHPQPMERIAKGEKTYELRLYDEKRRLLQVGDTIVFTQSNDPSRQVQVLIIGLHRFDDFCQLYAALPLERCGYTQQELSTAHWRDMEAYYSPAQQAKYGVLAIEIQRM